jgi:hypothetical protein
VISTTNLSSNIADDHHHSLSHQDVMMKSGMGELNFEQAARFQ